MPSAPLKTVTLACLTEEDARIVAVNADTPTDQDHGVVQNGAEVLITYRRPKRARDVVDYAWQTDRVDAQAAADANAMIDRGARA